MEHVARLVLAVTVLAVVALALLPTGMSSGYSCDGPPVARLLDPDTEFGSQYFFDVGAACNDHARARGWGMAAVAVVGLGASGALGVAGRRRRIADGSAERGADDQPVRSIW